MGKSKKSRKVQNFRADPTSSNGSNGHNGDFMPNVTSSVLDTISAQLQSGGLVNINGFTF